MRDVPLFGLDFTAARYEHALEAEGLARPDQFREFFMKGAEHAVTFGRREFHLVAGGARIAIDHV